VSDAAFIDILQTVFPVVAIAPGQDTELARPDFFGTAFAVGAGVFLTAAHVVRAAAEHGQVALGGPTSGSAGMGGVKVENWDVWPDRDVAILFCSARPPHPLDIWLAKPVQVLTDLASFGYPHAVTRANEHEHFEVVFRAYKGHVITTRGFDRLPGKPAVYEVSCAYPEGLSGAPVLLHHDGTLAVAGVVLGSDSVTYGGIEHRVGIAMMSDAILNFASETLGGPLERILKLAALQPGK
jgi:hypothetical protein